MAGSGISFTPFSASTERLTAFQIYDDDVEFQADADKIVYFVMRNLGSPEIDAEIDVKSIWQAFEQATIEYSQTINSHHARNVILDLMGQGTGSLSGSENAFPLGNQTEFARKQSLQYSAEFGAQGFDEWYSASVDLVPDKQVYDLWPILSGVLTGANANKGAIIREVHHYEPFASFRFFDTTSVLNFLGNSLNFESYSPETIFYLLPIWEDVLRGTQLELNQRVRRSNYSFDIKNYKLKLYPTPNASMKLWFEYTISPRDPIDPNIKGHQSKGVISNLSNIAFGHLSYKDINSMGRSWIWRMTLSFCKEILGHVWSKYATIPVLPDGVNLGGGELIARAREDQINLRQELRELLDQMSYKNLLVERNELEEATLRTQKQIPLLIYISN